MADYYPLLSRAVSGLPSSTPMSRRAIYDRASKALLGQLGSIQPPIPDEDIAREEKALEEAIARIEADHASPSVELAGTAAIAAALAELEQPDDTKPATPAVKPLPPASVRPPAAPPPSPPAAPSVSTTGVSTSGVSAPVVSAPPAAVRPSAPSASAAPPAVPVSSPVAAPATETSAPSVSVRPPAPLSAPAVSTPVSAPPTAAPAQANLAYDLDRPLPPAGPAVTASAPKASNKNAKAQGGRPDDRRPVALYASLGLVLIVLAGGIGYYAWKTKLTPEQFKAARPSSGPVSVPTASSQAPANAPKNESRAAGADAARTGEPPAEPATPERPRITTQADKPAQAPSTQTPAPLSTDQPPASTVAVAQRSAILIAAPTRENAQNVQTYVGTVVWRTDNVSRGTGQPLSLAVRADIDIPDAKFSAAMTVEKNYDTTRPASHTVTWRFQRVDDSPIPEIVEIDTLQMRDESSPTVHPLAGAKARITANIFIIALAAGESSAKRNLDLLEKKGWFDLPVRTSDNRLAKITLEKGTQGDRLLQDAMVRWAQP